MQKPDTIACADAIATLKGKFVAPLYGSSILL